MSTYPPNGLEGSDLEEDQRRERLKWVFYGGFAILLVICCFYIQLSAEQRVLHVYGLTVLVYGALFYVEEFEIIGSLLHILDGEPRFPKRGKLKVSQTCRHPE
jgi:hypothetical protein